MFFFMIEIVGVILKRLNFINPFASKIIKLPAELKGLKTTPQKNEKVENYKGQRPPQRQ